MVGRTKQPDKSSEAYKTIWRRREKKSLDGLLIPKIQLANKGKCLQEISLAVEVTTERRGSCQVL